MTNPKAQNHSPEVSVIILTMNRRHCLRSCLESIFRQTFSDLEVIVVDNGSTDGTGDTVRNEFPQAQYFRLDTNVGAPGGRNYGIRRARGKICVFLDDDAIFEESEAIEKAVAYFRSNEKLGLLAFRILDPHYRLEEYKSIPRADKTRIDDDYGCAYFCAAGFACRRLIFEDIGMFWEPLFYTGEELELSYRILEGNYTILRAAGISVVHYETPQARVPGKWIYFGVRNRFWVALRHLPWAYVATHALLWWGHLFVLSLKNRHPFFFFQGVRDAVLGIPEVLKDRSRLSLETLGELRRLSGRTWY
jgi:GT2 family glycosyltransferase